MGFTCELKEIFNLTYKVQFDNNISEHEFDHIFVGSFEGDPQPDESEVEAWRWIHIRDLVDDIAVRPESYSYWLRVLMIETAVQWLPAFQEGLVVAGSHLKPNGTEASSIERS